MTIIKTSPPGAITGRRILNIPDLSEDEKRFLDFGSPAITLLDWYEATEKITGLAAIRGRSAREITEALLNVRIGDWNALETAAVPLLKKGCRR